MSGRREAVRRCTNTAGRSSRRLSHAGPLVPSTVDRIECEDRSFDEIQCHAGDRVRQELLGGLSNVDSHRAAHDER